MAIAGIADLRQTKAQKVDSMEAIVSKAAAENRELNDTESTAFDELKAEAEGLEKAIARAEDIVRLKASNATPVEVKEPAFSGREFAAPKAPEEKGTKVARVIRALAATKGISQFAAQFASQTLHDEQVAKALGANTGSAGGFLVPEDWSAEIIEFLRPAAVVRSMGAVVMPMPNGSVLVPKQAGGASAAYIGENSNVQVSEASFGQLRLTARKLGVLTAISNDLIRFSNPAADVVVRNDLIRAMAQKEDASFIRGQGLSNEPKGLRYWAASGNVVAANGTVNLANVTSDLSALILKLEQANVAMTNPGWLFAPRTKAYLMQVRDGNGNYAFRDEMLTGSLWGFPFKTTTQIPVNLGGGTNESEVYLVDFADAIIGDTMQIMVDVSSDAAYHDGSNVQAAFSLDQTVVRVISQHDFGLRHTESVAVLTGVTWTP